MAITIDGPNLLVTLPSAAGSPSFGFLSVSVQVELYSFWKTWVLLSDNAKFPPLFTTIGGNDLGGGLEAGDYYFIQNQFTSSGSPQQGGWRIKPAEENAVYVLVGNLYAQDPTLPILSGTDGNFSTSIRFETSSLTQTVITDQMNTIESKIDIIDTTTTSNAGKLDLIQLDVTNILSVVDDIIKHHHNRTFIDGTAFTLTVYEDDGVTPHKVYDLKDDAGVASITSIFERIPQAGSP